MIKPNASKDSEEIEKLEKKFRRYGSGHTLYERLKMKNGSRPMEPIDDVI
jgi:hypothetical protein